MPPLSSAKSATRSIRPPAEWPIVASRRVHPPLANKVAASRGIGGLAARCMKQLDGRNAQRSPECEDAPNELHPEPLAADDRLCGHAAGGGHRRVETQGPQ